jgi:hypothetical protein
VEKEFKEYKDFKESSVGAAIGIGSLGDRVFGSANLRERR